MILTKKRELLLKHAFKHELPKELNETMKLIWHGKKKIEVSKTKIHFTDTKETIQLTDHPMNQIASLFINKFGEVFGLLYLSAVIGGKKGYYSTLNTTLFKEKIHKNCFKKWLEVRNG